MKDIRELIPCGRQNRISTRDLMQKSGITSERKPREEIRRARINGAIIASCKAGGGYFRPETREELRAFVESFSQEGQALFAVLKAARAELGLPEGQETLELEDGSEDKKRQWKRT